jgi:hypothetical protein
MARKLKTFQTSLGFFDLAIAAPSMKAALEAWGADSNLFHQGAAKESQDPDVVAATMAAPGVVLKRPVGSSGPFRENADLPTDLVGEGSGKRAGRNTASGKPRRHPKRATDPVADRKAALAFEREQKRRERESAKEEAARQRERAHRQHAIDNAQSALDTARLKYEENAAGIQAELERIEEKARAEEARWTKEKTRLETALRRARA